ncbi:MULTISPECIES: hypothetical protein [Xanthomonas]|uniref:hypothetical protein n=1 Tax=Xanthomonas TaxID=338 RepID=UPI0012905C3A|nr:MULTISPECIES: hypothetical protein [Xanthomonas]
MTRIRRSRRRWRSSNHVIKEERMQRRLLVFIGLIGLASTNAVAFAETVRGPAGRMQLPDGVTATVAPSNPTHPNVDASAIITLTNVQPGAIGPVTIEMSCPPAIGQLNSAKGMERLAAVTFQLDKNLKREKAEWVELDAQQTYRTDASRADGTRLTQWLVPLGTSFAWIKFDRPGAAPLQQDVLDAISGIKLLCGSMAENKKVQ